MLAVAAAALALAAPSPVPSFRHVVVIVFENKERSELVGNQEAPTFAHLARGGATLPRYYGVSHPSLPNYIALVSGSTQGITTDCVDCEVSAPSLATSIAAAGKSWKTYAEGLPFPGSTAEYPGLYAKTHDPFIYFRGLDKRKIVPFGQLLPDLAARRLPDFSLIVPNVCNDMHSCPISVGDQWLSDLITPLLLLPRTAVFVIFDEGSSDLRGGGMVPAFVVGTAVRPGTTYRRVTGHYGVLRTIEDAWNLPRLGASAQAAPITGIWR
jgi:hypothetical protein